MGTLRSLKIAASSVFFLFLITMMNMPGEGVGSEEKELADLGFSDDFQFSGSTADGRYDGSEGDVLTVIIKVVNIGNSPAENVDVTLMIDDEVIKVSTIRTIKNDTEDIKTVIFSWVAEEGTHDIRIEIDPDRNIEEINDQDVGENNNVISKDVSIKGGDLKGLDFPPIYWVLTSFVPVIIFAAKRRVKRQ